MKVNTYISTVIVGENLSRWQLCESIDSHKLVTKKQKKMKAFKLFKTYYSYIENKVVKEPYWTEALKKDLVKLLDDTETKMKKENASYMRINDTTLYEHTEYNGVVLDFTFTIEEVTI